MRILWAILLVGNGFAEPLELPRGWMHPVAEDFQGAWRKASPSRYLELGVDLDCDESADSAVILQPEKGPGIGLFVFLRDSAGWRKAKLLFDSRKDAPGLKSLSGRERSKLQFWYRSQFGIRPAERGLFPTACGQGYRLCEKGEKKKVELECGGIDFFPNDQSGNTYFFRDRKKKKFLSALMND